MYAKIVSFTVFFLLVAPACGVFAGGGDGDVIEVDADTTADGDIEPADHTARCAAFCIPETECGDGGDCGASDEDACFSECMALLDGFDSGCASCVLSESKPPTNFCGTCEGEVITGFIECENFCD